MSSDKFVDLKMVFTDEAQATELLTPIFNQLKIWHYVCKVIGVHSECLQYDEETGECLQELVREGWLVDVRVVTEKASLFDPLAVYCVQPKNEIHTFA